MSNLSIAGDSVQLISNCWFNVPVNYCICSATKQIIDVLFIHTSATFLFMAYWCSAAQLSSLHN